MQTKLFAGGVLQQLAPDSQHDDPGQLPSQHGEPRKQHSSQPPPQQSSQESPQQSAHATQHGAPAAQQFPEAGLAL